MSAQDGLAAVIDQVAMDCCTTLVPPGAAKPVPVADEQLPTELVAVVGFSGDKVRGTIGLCATLSALESTHPSTIAGLPTTRRDLEDWLGESANQLLGRLKAQLQRYGVSMWMGTPLVLRGISVAVAATNEHVRRYELAMPQGQFYTFWLDLDVDPGVALEVVDEPVVEAAPGDFLLFP